MASTMKDIAKRTGLGLATISKYLNGGKVRPNNKKLIDEAVRDLHFVPNEFARGLKTSQSRTIGVVIPELSNVFCTCIITAVEDMLRKQNYAVIVCDCRSDPKREKDAISFLINKRVDGLINMPTDTTGEHLVPALEANIPIVLVDRILKPLSGKVSAVIVDNVDAGEKTTRLLIEKGHTSIGLILGDPEVFTTQKRLEGYMNGLREHHLTPREDYLLYSDYTMEGGYTAMKKLLAMPDRPSAVFVTNYYMTLGAIIALNEAQVSIPDDLSFIGFDKLDLFDAIYPHLMLVKQPLSAISECVAKQLLTLLSDEKALPQVIMLSTQLREGTTVKGRSI